MRVDVGTVREVNALLRQLSGSFTAKKCTVGYLRSVVGSGQSEVWVARENGHIVGMATLALVLKPGGIVARVEDVVVDERARGKGIGRKVVDKIIERAKKHRASFVVLSSRPSRAAANALYAKLGFKIHGTNLYQKRLS